MPRTGLDVIISLCGGLKKNGAPHPWVVRRLEKTVELYTGKEYVLLSARGTPHKPPPRDRDGFPIDECAASAKYLVRKGLNSRKILLERTSMDTIGNAYFSRILFIEPMRLKRLLVVTSAFHMPRAQKIFRWVYGLKPAPFRWNVKFVSASDGGLEKDLIRMKANKERIALRKLAPLLKRIRTMRDMHRFIFFEHGAYAYGKFKPSLKGKMRNSY